MQTTFNSKVDRWLVTLVVIPLTVAPTAVLVAMLLAWPGWGPVAALLLSFLPGPAIVFVFAWPVRYDIGAGQITVRSGLFLRWRVPLAGIESIMPSRSILSSPAWSLDRLAIAYRDPTGGRRQLVVSPDNRDTFYDAILQRTSHLCRIDSRLEPAATSPGDEA